MKSHGDSGLVPTCWGKTVIIEWTPPTYRMELKQPARMMPELFYKFILVEHQDV